MITIYNNKTSHSINIDDSSSRVFFSPNEWEIDSPYIKIELANFDFIEHAYTCKDCKAFMDAMGSSTSDWYIKYLGKTKRLNLYTLGQLRSENHLIKTISTFFSGTEIKLNIDTDTMKSLTVKLREEEEKENYEGCVLINEKIKSISD